MRTLWLILLFNPLYAQQRIDREALVQRHAVHVQQLDPLSSLSVGNGNFAFTVDATGMQSFPDVYAPGVPLGTQSVWGWHSFPNTEGLRFGESIKEYALEGRKIPYSVQLKNKAVDYFRANPHRLQLGNIGMEIIKKDGTPATPKDIRNIHQQLNMWSGIITSEFTVEDVPVKVITACHPQRDAVAFRISSPLLQEQRLMLRVRIPYPSGAWKDVGNHWNTGQPQSTTFSKDGYLECSLDTTRYYVGLRWSSITGMREAAPHYFLITPAKADDFELTAEFSLNKPAVPAFHETQRESAQAWKTFWQSGGAVDLSGSTDPRAHELERRVVLSLYLTRIQCAAGYPPQETGLTYNSWFGKPHLEMHWWHAVHFALWGRPELMEKSLDWYFTVADKARRLAVRQGFEGIRWQKMTDNNGDESPSSVAAFLIWQQPHFIYMAELLYRHHQDEAVLNKYKDLLFATADFMASFPTYDARTGRYNLGKGLIPAQECFDAVTTFNPTYELAYWHWALSTAQLWRERLQLPREKKWDEILTKLAPLPQQNGVYLATESTPDCYTNERYLTDHPAVLGAYSTLPAVNGLDTTVMKNTLELVWQKWKWDHTWGWDFPLVAMTAARLHMPEKALDALLMPVRTNTYLINGHNYQDERLTIYLPGNGGLLSAVAMMCAGVDAGSGVNIGFPSDGSWNVKWEGLHKMF